MTWMFTIFDKKHDALIYVNKAFKVETCNKYYDDLRTHDPRFDMG